jgi:squalene-hopene/tetraprenyl-beta-curcumene cyclase
VGWQGAARDHGTFCISCHTALPYALSRPTLRKELSDAAPTVEERQLLDDVTKRVRSWDKIEPYYSDQTTRYGKTIESRGTEAVLNALILASHDAERGHLSDDTRSAFVNMWSLQETAGDNKGSWEWLEFGHFEPWEADDSRYYGAGLAAIAVGIAPENYRSAPEIQGNLRSLREYMVREYSNESMLNHVMLLWASTKLPGLIEPERQKAIVKEVLSKQQFDGGWRLAPLVWRWRGWTPASFGRLWLRSDGTWVERESDGYATGLITFALLQSGLPPANPQLQQALAWLASNQDSEGAWHSDSLNKRRNPSSNVGRFMSDAATAYAVLALTENNNPNRAAAEYHDPHQAK